MTEFEKKLLISKDEYNYLMEHFNYENTLLQKNNIKQINYYFDTDDFSMNRQNITCRIRLKDGKYKGIIKQHSLNSEQSTETEIETCNGIENNTFTNMGLKLQGELVTERCVIFKDFNCEVSLDKNEYLGQIDYELEIEYAPHHENDAQLIQQIFCDMLARRKCFLAYKKNYIRKTNIPSKSTRFFERKATTNQESAKSVSKSEMEYTSNYTDPDEYIRNYFDSIMP